MLIEFSQIGFNLGFKFKKSDCQFKSKLDYIIYYIYLVYKTSFEHADYFIFSIILIY